MGSVSVSSKGQVVIPQDVRQRLGIKAGSRLELIELAGEVRLKPQQRAGKTATIEEGIGLAAYKGPPISIEAMDLGVREVAAERYLRSRSAKSKKVR